ncbi:CHC2 zinc finger domain-containing protein [Streptacidiphilus rugosus]|uniref:CHC2 zinc finger domain-containing protein n=1 Tax=Streptacidiphilus rugosus TaxID=405783 RepID=UPI00056420E8|nr:CHC2 zinc finger domain-containing protein [Streptacidiphilus rugosus]
MPALTLAAAAARHTDLVRVDSRTLQGRCQFHEDTSSAGTFYVSEHQGVYNCFGCGSTGDLTGFLMRAEGLSRDEALRRAA